MELLKNNYKNSEFNKKTCDRKLLTNNQSVWTY
jgi:hypothetical protein